MTFAPVAFNVSELLTGLPAGTCGISVALDVNDKDQTVGWYKEVTGATRAFFHSNATGALTLPNRGGNQAAAYAISNLGVIVGFDSTAGAKHAVTWTKSGGVYVLTDVQPAGYMSSEANDVNDSGMITGRVCVTASNCRVARWPTAAAAPWVSGIVPGSDVDVMWPIPVRAISVDTAGVITGVRKVGAAQMSFFVLPTTTLAVSIAANPVITSESSPRGRTIGLTVSGATSQVYMRYGGVATAMSAAASSWGTGVNKCGDVIWNEFTGAVYFSRYSYRSVCDP